MSLKKIEYQKKQYEFKKLQNKLFVNDIMKSKLLYLNSNFYKNFLT